MKSFYLSVCLLIPSSLFPQTGEPVLYRAKAVHTVSGETFRPGELLVEKDRIIAVGKNLKSRSKPKLIDWPNLQIYPGLISPASSLGLAEISALRPTRDYSEVGDFTPDVEAWVAVNPDSELIPVARANGVAHALVAPMGGTIAGTSGLVRLDGWGVEAMTVKKSVALHVWWPGLALNAAPKEQWNDPKQYKSLKEQAKNRKRVLAKIDDFFDDAEAYAQAKKVGGQNFAIVPAWEAMLPFLRGKAPVMVHADELRQIKMVVAWAKRRKLRLILAGARDAWQTADLLAKEKVPVIFQHVFTAPSRDLDPHDVHFRAPGFLVKAGVKTAIGLRLGSWTAANLRNLPYHAAHAVPYGLSRKDALAAITLHPAEILGVANRLGSLAKGKEATFLAADGDLLDPRTIVRHLVLAGKETSLESRHTRLYEKYRRRPSLAQGAKNKMMVIQVDKAGLVLIDGRAVEPDAVAGKIKGAKPTKVVIRAHKAATYAKIRGLMEIVSKLGIGQVNFATSNDD